VKIIKYFLFAEANGHSESHARKKLTNQGKGKGTSQHTNHEPFSVVFFLNVL